MVYITASVLSLHLFVWRVPVSRSKRPEVYARGLNSWMEATLIYMIAEIQVIENANIYDMFEL